MHFSKFISTPLSTVICATCQHWGGARVIKDGISNSCASFQGSCITTRDIFEHDNLLDSRKKAIHAKCKYWAPINNQE